MNPTLASLADRVFTQRERQEIGAMLTLRESARGPSCKPLGNWLVATAMRTWPRLSGLAFWKKTNSKRTWVLVSLHHPARLCWSWSVWIAFFRNSGGHGVGRFWRSYRGDWSLAIPRVLEISFHRQTYDWMLSITAQQRLEAAAIYLPRAEPEIQQFEERRIA